MSREYRFSLVVSEHDPARADAIAAAVAGWLNEDASEELPVRRTDINGALAFEFRVGMGGGWPVLGSAKSVTLRVGQANGGPCRVDWASWLLDMPQCTLELPAQTDDASADNASADNAWVDPDVAGDEWSDSDPALTTQSELPCADSIEPPDPDAEGATRTRRFFVQATVSGPREAAVVMSWLRSADDWTDEPHGHGYDGDTFVDATISLSAGHTLRAHAERWLAALEAGHGDRVELWVGAWDLDLPTEERVFQPDSFPIQEPEREIVPQNGLATAMPLGAGNDRCGYCGSVEGLRRLNSWSPPEIRAAVDENVASWAQDAARPSRAGRSSHPSICRSCLETILARLAPAASVKAGLFETDGNPFGAVDRPDLPCMTCATPATEEIVVLNHNQTFGICRACLRGAADELEAAYARAVERGATRRWA
ncbi:MAG TPA: hypothetical protein VNF73_01730 [Candidatus Saccharimonadales bacterium]|nr:hypothetical protein [Candidatus Saccharimonadales bacterium]